MACGDEDCWEDVICILSVHPMPGEDLVLEMHASRAVNNNCVGTRGHVGQPWQIHSNSVSKRFLPAVIQQIHVVRALCASRYLSKRVDVQPHIYPLCIYPTYGFPLTMTEAGMKDTLHERSSALH